MACLVTPGSDTFASSVIAYADCQASTIGEQGYLALAANGSSVSQLITILLTIVIALFGYRLLLGGTPTLREGVMTLVKVGVVVAFATSWPAYQTVVYNVAITAPSEFGTTIGGAAQLPGAAGDLAAHLDAVDQQFQTLSIYNVNRPVVPLPPGTVPPPLFAG
jgi:type IV secretion system protein VirB6